MLTKCALNVEENKGLPVLPLLMPSFVVGTIQNLEDSTG